MLVYYSNFVGVTLYTVDLACMATCKQLYEMFLCMQTHHAAVCVKSKVGIHGCRYYTTLIHIMHCSKLLTVYMY